MKIALIEPDDLKRIVSDVLKTELHELKNLFPEPLPDDWMSRNDAAKKCGISLPTLDKYTKEGKIKGHRIGTRVRYKLSELERAFVQIKSLKYQKKEEGV